MGAIEDIINDEDLEKGCAEMLKAGAWFKKETGLSLEIFFQWSELLDSDPQLCLQQITSYMQTQEPETRCSV